MNKKIIIGILVVLIIGGGYFYFAKISKNKNQTRYVLTKVERGTILVSVSGSGQISAKDQIEIRPKVSGEVLEIHVKEGQKVKAGDLLLELDPKNYQRAIDDAKIALDNAKQNLENLKKNKETAQKDLKEAYENSFNLISQNFNNLTQIIQTAEPIFTKSSYLGEEGDVDYYRSVVGLYTGQIFPKRENEKKFLELKDKYQQTRDRFILISKNSQPEVLEEWLEITLNLLKQISDLMRTARDTISFYKEIIQNEKLTPSIPLSVTENQFTILSNFVSLLDQNVSSLSSLSKSIDQLKTSISNFEDSIQIQQEIIKQKENTLSDAKENYENCFVKAPYDGIVAKINVKKRDNVSTQTSLFTFIATQKIAELTLNEIDAAKVKIGQKAILTLDALPELTLTGEVTEIDTLGTISQGVTSYGIKIGLDSDDERIKPGMSFDAQIIVETKIDVLTLPNSAIKTQGDLRYVELVEAPEKVKKKLKIGVPELLPRKIKIKNQPIKIGISNDEKTEILSGVSEGDIVISSKIAPKTQTTQTQFRFQIPGMGMPPAQRR